MQVEIRPFKLEDEKAVIQLWHDCGLVVSENDPAKDIARKKTDHPELFLIAVKNGEVVGTVMGGYDGHRGAINYLAVAPDHRHHGIGRLLMASVEEKIIGLGCAKINLYVRNSNEVVRVFYEKLGYSQNAGIISFGKRLVNDEVHS